MTDLGKVTELWRYPVKSMQGERVATDHLGPVGLPGDRGWALRDEEAGEIRGAKKMPMLLGCKARYVSEPEGDKIPVAEIEMPDGSKFLSDADEASERLSGFVGRQVTLWPRRSAEDLDHYRRAMVAGEDLEGEMREVFGRLPDEPLPDITAFGPELLEFTSPLGTYFDAFPLHLLTTAWLSDLQSKAPDSNFSPLRFRPNVLIEPVAGTPPGPFERDWVGREIAIGDARLAITLATVRCSMTFQPQPGLAKDPQVLRTIVRQSDQNLGVYASVIVPGRVREGDAVRFV